MLAAWTGAIVPVVTLSLAAAILAGCRRSIRQTTLAGPWLWTWAALGAWSAVEFSAALAAGRGATWLAPARLAAAALGFCPAVSLIGAKRPQHAAWNFVVVSLWTIVALPAAENFFLHPGERLALGDARSWFLWILLLLGPINFVPTRYWLAAVLVAAGQFLVTSRYLALVQRPLVPQPGLVGLACCGCGLLAAALAARRVAGGPHACDRLWLDFRDSFGLFWSLRVQERVNAAAEQYGWDLELGWTGFRQRSRSAAPAAQDAATQAALRTTLTGLLRRFVSHDWIATRTRSGDAHFG